MTFIHGIILFAAAFAAGMVNAIAGGGTLITFPILIWVGLDPRVANATSTVALWPGLLGGLWGYRHEMENSRPLLLRFGIASVLGGAVGGALLIATPTTVFARLVPFLILFATFLFMAQEPISRRLRTPTPTGTWPATSRWWWGAIILQFLSAIYGGYFGAGNGILMLAVLGLIGVSDLHQANGIKTFLGLVLNSAAILGFVLSGLVHWPVALLMAAGAIAGGYYGARLARLVGRAVVRRAVIVIGLVIGLVMLWRVGH